VTLRRKFNGAKHITEAAGCVRFTKFATKFDLRICETALCGRTKFLPEVPQSKKRKTSGKSKGGNKAVRPLYAVEQISLQKAPSFLVLREGMKKVADFVKRMDR
jgi:hypothetical protein